jgi:hypothetical protein
MAQFSGCEPLVGEIVGLRSFRVDESGLLLPLYAKQAWYDGTNTAVCAPPTGERGRTDHPVAAPDCECGFYAYGTEIAGARNRNMRFVQAVVSCWGSVVAGTQGVRAQYARIDAIWLGAAVPRGLRARIAQHYPSARIYADKAAMLGEHPLSVLPCYDSPPQHRSAARAVSGLLGAAMLGLGLLPSSLVVGAVRDVWLAATLLTAAFALWLLIGSHGRGHLAAAVVFAGLTAWLVAPMFGWAGWLLRLPVLRALLVAAGGYLLSLRRGYFPVVKTVRQRTFCGVRP